MYAFEPQYYRIMALEFHVEEKRGLGHYTLCEFIDIGARRWILTERLRNLPSDLGRPPLLHSPSTRSAEFPSFAVEHKQIFTSKSGEISRDSVPGQIPAPCRRMLPGRGSTQRSERAVDAGGHR